MKRAPRSDEAPLVIWAVGLCPDEPPFAEGRKNSSQRLFSEVIQPELPDRVIFTICNLMVLITFHAIYTWVVVVF
jgi:hypothetical protein